MFSTSPVLRNTSTLDKKFLDKAIKIATQKFISGCSNNKNFYNKVSSNNKLKEQTHHDSVSAATLPKIPQFNDACFPEYNANIISGTNFVAAAGPISAREVAEFFYNLAFNEKLVTPVREIIALGNGLIDNEYPGIKGDFFDYPTASGDKQVIYTSHKKSYQIEATYLEVAGVIQTAEDGLRYASDKKPIQSKLKLKYRGTKKVAVNEIDINITFHPLKDNCSLDLRNTSDETKEIYLQHYKIALQNPVLIHCASGVGRTGHLIFIFELLRNYSTIFLSATPEQAAEKILAVLNRIRLTRPGLVWTRNQFWMAIHNAIILHEYALAKGYFLDHQQQIKLQTTSVPNWIEFPSPAPEPQRFMQWSDLSLQEKQNLLEDLKKDQLLLLLKAQNKAKRAQNFTEAMIYLESVMKTPEGSEEKNPGITALHAELQKARSRVPPCDLPMLTELVHRTALKIEKPNHKNNNARYPIIAAKVQNRSWGQIAGGRALIVFGFALIGLGLVSAIVSGGGTLPALGFMTWFSTQLASFGAVNCGLLAGGFFLGSVLTGGIGIYQQVTRSQYYGIGVAANRFFTPSLPKPKPVAVKKEKIYQYTRPIRTA